MNRIALRPLAALAVGTALLAGCHGGGSSLPARAPANSARATIALTVTRQLPAVAGRTPQTIPPSATSVDARLYLGASATGTPATTSCVQFAKNTRSATLTISAPINQSETLVISSWSGGCTPNPTATLGTTLVGSVGSGQLLTTFSGTGTPTASSTNAATVFNGGNPISLSAPAAPTAGVVPNVGFTNLGPTWTSTFTSSNAYNDLIGSGKIQSVVPVGPSTSSSPAQIMYVAGGDGNGFEVNVSSGIYKTTDGGKTWYGIGPDNGLSDTRVNALYVDQSDPNIVIAGTQFGGIYRSTNGGSNWTNVDPTDAPANAFALSNGTLYAATGNGVMQSTDDGATWTLAGTGSAVPNTTGYGGGMDSVAASGNTVIAGDYSGYTYTFNGLTWTQGGQLGTPAGTALTCGSGYPPAVHSIVIDATTPTTVWATAWSCTLGGQAVSQELYLSSNSGKTWADVATQGNGSGSGGNPSGWYGAQMIAPSATVAHRIYVGAEFMQWSVTPNLSGATPTANFSRLAGNGTYGDMRGLTVVPNGSGGDACYIAADQGFYYQGTCGADGLYPQALTAGLSTNYLYGFGVSGSPGSESLVVTTQDFNPNFSGNGGTTWPGLFGGTSSLGEGGDAEIDPLNPNACVLSQTSTNFLNYGANSGSGCGSFTPTTFATAPSAVTSLSFSHKTAGLLFIGAGSSGIYKSTDDGTTAAVISGSTALTTGGGTVQFVRVDPTNDSNLLAIVSNSGGTSSSIERSTNGGATWTAATGLAGGTVAALAVDPQNDLNVVAVGGGPNLTIYTSTNGGASFTPSNPGTLSVARQRMEQIARRSTPLPIRFAPPRPPWRFGPLITGELSPPVKTESWVQAAIQPQYATSLEFNDFPAVVSSSTKPFLALATGYGLFISPDLGTTWTEVDVPGSGVISRRFTKVEWNDDYLYASTDGQGLLRSTAPLQ